MRDHTSGQMFGSDARHGQRRSGAVLALVPDLEPDLEPRPAPDRARHSDPHGVDAGVSARPGHRPARRPASGPRPVRPAGAGVARPVAGCRTVSRAPGLVWPEPPAAGPGRVLARAPQGVSQGVSQPLAWKFRVRRAVAGVVAVLVTAAVVVGLGLLADAVAVARQSAGVERTVTDGSLTPVQGGPGQVLGVPVR